MNLMMARLCGKVSCLVFLTALLLFPIPSTATPEYAERTGQGCKICHANLQGSSLTDKGLEYAGSGYVWPPIRGYRVIGPFKKSVRLVIGYLHIVAAFLWLGTILYVHLILRPEYAVRGLPKGEVSVGIGSFVIVGVTGLLLTVSRIKSVDVLFTSRWGILLSLKIIIYVIMVSTAIFVAFYLGPKLKKGVKRAAMPKDAVFDPVALSAFDGREGRPAYIAYQGKVYDVTGLPLWEQGAHMKRHSAGTDLTEALTSAPHGTEKLKTLKVAGTYNSTLKPKRSPLQKAFYSIAYMNLVLALMVLLVVAFLRWGI